VKQPLFSSRSTLTTFVRAVHKALGFRGPVDETRKLVNILIKLLPNSIIYLPGGTNMPVSVLVVEFSRRSGGRGTGYACICS
jgi:hypothetical protein